MRSDRSTSRASTCSGFATPGVEVARLRALHWFTIHDASDRSHVRVVVVDGRVGYTGGFGLADYWLGDGHHDEQWRESNVRFAGPGRDATAGGVLGGVGGSRPAS